MTERRNSNSFLALNLASYKRIEYWHFPFIVENKEVH